MISSTGHFDGAIRYLTEKARTTYYMLRNSSLKYNHPIKHCLQIFDSLLKPILCYGSEVWVEGVDTPRESLSIKKTGSTKKKIKKKIQPLLQNGNS